jgi:selenocysteine lyase/cysteine desulfurase
VPRTPTLTFTVTGLSTEEVARRLVTRGLYLSNGDFYASTIVARYGQEPDGLVRAGCACYSTLSEVERLVEGVRAIARGA